MRIPKGKSSLLVFPFILYIEGNGGIGYKKGKSIFFWRERTTLYIKQTALQASSLSFVQRNPLFRLLINELCIVLESVIFKDINQNENQVNTEFLHALANST